MHRLRTISRENNLCLAFFQVTNLLIIYQSLGLHYGKLKTISHITGEETPCMYKWFGILVNFSISIALQFEINSSKYFRIIYLGLAFIYS